MRPYAILLAGVLTLAFFIGLSAEGRGGDITAPVLVEASASRREIDTSLAPQTVTFTLHITDDLSGIKSVQVELHHEYGYNASRTCQVGVEPAKAQAILLCAVNFPRYSAEGRWMVIWLTLKDAVGNTNASNMVDCVESNGSGGCTQYEYNEHASAAVKAMEIRIGPIDTGQDPPLFLPWVSSG